MTSIYSLSAHPVNSKIGSSVSSFFRLLLQVEYSLINLISLNMCRLALSINKKLQTLQNQKVLKKSHRITYFDLLTYNDTFEPFTITQGLLQRILNLSKAQVKKILSFLEYLGLLKRTYATMHNGERDIPNYITLQLVYPLEINTALPTPPIAVLAEPFNTFTAEFVEIEPRKGTNSVLLKDVSNTSKDTPIYTKYYWLDYTAENSGFLDTLEEGDFIEFSADPESFKNKNGEDRWFFKNIKIKGESTDEQQI